MSLIGLVENWLYLNPLLSFFTYWSKYTLVVCLRITINWTLYTPSYLKKNIVYSNDCIQIQIFLKTLISKSFWMNITRHGGSVADSLLGVLSCVTKTRLFGTTMCFFKLNSKSHNILFSTKKTHKGLHQMLSLFFNSAHIEVPADGYCCTRGVGVCVGGCYWKEVVELKVCNEVIVWPKLNMAHFLH